MLKRAAYFFLSILLQIGLFGIPVAGAETGVIQATKLQTLTAEGKYGIESGVHYASSVNIEGSAGIEDVSACMEIISDALDALPRQHSESVENLSLIFDLNAKRGQGGGDIVKIRCADVSEEELIAVLIHEVGHVVDTGLIDNEFCSRKTTYNNGPCVPNGTTGLSNDGSESAFTDGSRAVFANDKSVDFYSISWVANDEFQDSTSSYSFVSEYAMTDPFEDFAESYLYYVLHGESFRRLTLVNSQLEAKYDFLRDYVFDGVEYGGVDWYEAPLFDRPYDSTLLPYDLEGFLM